MRKVRRRRRGWTSVLVFLVGRARGCTPNITCLFLRHRISQKQTVQTIQINTGLSYHTSIAANIYGITACYVCTLLSTTKTIILRQSCRSAWHLHDARYRVICKDLVQAWDCIAFLLRETYNSTVLRGT